MAVENAPLTRADLREELAGFRDEIRTHYATKADLANLETRLVKWLVGATVVAASLASTVVTLVDRLVP